MKKIIYLLFIPCFIFCSCRDVMEIINAEDQLVAISQVDVNFNFKDIATFSVNDTINIISIDILGKETKTKRIATYQKDLIVAQMEERGFIYVPLNELSRSNLPDLFFDLIDVENQYIQVSGLGWWYDYYDPYWFNYWELGPFYPYYPVYYTAISSYTAKSFIMDCMYLKETPNHKYNAQSCFFGLVRGIANEYEEDEIKKYINQCFDQTPELNRN